MIDQQKFKNCMSNMASNVCVAIAESKSGNYSGVTINTFTSLSMDPFLVLFNLKKESFCYQDFMLSKKFAVNLLSESQQDLSNLFTSEISQEQWSSIKCLQESMPCFKNSVAYLECKTHKIYDGGSHSIIIGEVQFIREINQEASPLIYYNRNYYPLKR